MPRKYATKEFGSVIGALLCMLVISIVTSFANAGLDPTRLKSVENITNMCLNASITIFGVVSAISLGTVATKSKTGKDNSPGRYMQEYAAFNRIRQAIEHKRAAFSAWHQEQYLKEIHAKKINYLLSFNIEQPEIVLQLTREQLVTLEVPQCFIIENKECYLKALTHEQMRAVDRVLSGKVSIHKLPDFYFLYVDGKGKFTFYEQAYSENIDSAITLVSRVVYKVFIGFVITSILTSLIITNPEQCDAAWVIKSLVMIFARIFNAISSTFWGYQIGQTLVYKECYYINGKTQFLNAFDRDVTVVTEQSSAKQDFLNSKGGNAVGNENSQQGDFLG